MAISFLRCRIVKTICKAIILLTLISVSTGCATILSGRSQTITLNSNPPGARCELVREGRIIGTVEKTPGAVTLDKTKHDIDVLCKKDGYVDAKEFANSGLEGSVFGNILLGGGIGWAIDSAAGTDNHYPDVVTVNLVPVELPPSPSKKAIASKAVAVSAKSDIEKRLGSLKQMKDDGLITDQEYQKKKSEILDSL